MARSAGSAGAVLVLQQTVPDSDLIPSNGASTSRQRDIRSSNVRWVDLRATRGEGDLRTALHSSLASWRDSGQVCRIASSACPHGLTSLGPCSPVTRQPRPIVVLTFSPVPTAPSASRSSVRTLRTWERGPQLAISRVANTRRNPKPLRRLADRFLGSVSDWTTDRCAPIGGRRRHRRAAARLTRTGFRAEYRVPWRDPKQFVLGRRLLVGRSVGSEITGRNTPRYARCSPWWRIR